MRGEGQRVWPWGWGFVLPHWYQHHWVSAPLLGWLPAGRWCWGATCHGAGCVGWEQVAVALQGERDDVRCGDAVLPEGKGTAGGGGGVV